MADPRPSPTPGQEWYVICTHCWHVVSEGDRAIDHDPPTLCSHLQGCAVVPLFASSPLPAGGLSEEDLAKLFHETYERLAPEFGYRTRDESAVPWEHVPPQNRALMIETCAVVLARLASAPNREDPDA